MCRWPMGSEALMLPELAIMTQSHSIPSADCAVVRYRVELPFGWGVGGLAVVKG
jgi:hypothetical protein